jgi:hypothetical protein
MALNAGRSAIKAGNLEAARAFYDVSRAGQFTHSEGTARIFATLRAELATDLGIVEKTGGTS